MRNYQRTLTSIFICHFALTPEPLVRLSWNFVLIILYTRGRSGANFSPIQPKKCWSSRGQFSLQMTICKGKEEAGSSRWSFATIPAPPSPWFWSFGEPSSLQMIICKGTEEQGGGQIIRWIICKGHWYLRHWCMMVLGQCRPVLAGIWWYWVSMGQYWLVLGDTGSV